ncbi:short-chain dehydrogenase [Frondihabitans sucicola]|uniref:Short-chain dehydrogenase n=2 Tax=Frondihabitans sucicola TaxID=1268041 RepID=A0ABM8GPY8_9MICO|nr:short-chain dehydrogenase [Frondihabitans sucicola]
MGRATAVAAARAGWTVVVSGRRQDALDETVRLSEATRHAGEGGGRVAAVVCDVREASSVAAARDVILRDHSRIDALVLSAGLNSPQRAWVDQSLATFDDIVQTNLTAAVRVVDASLPQLREHAGQVVVVSSYSGWQFSPGAGVAYSASKTALSSVCRTLNAQEAGSGVRACHLCPGDVDTDFLAMRPSVPDAEARGRMLTADDIARAALFVLDSPPHVRIDELVISPVSQH